MSQNIILSRLCEFQIKIAFENILSYFFSCKHWTLTDIYIVGSQKWVSVKKMVNFKIFMKKKTFAFICVSVFQEYLPLEITYPSTLHKVAYLDCGKFSDISRIMFKVPAIKLLHKLYL